MSSSSSTLPQLIRMPTATDQDKLFLLNHGPCNFDRFIFEKVCFNLLRNPNITSSHLFRADILYDSTAGNLPEPADENISPLPPIEFADLEVRRTRTLVRRLIPRNPQLDRPLLQTCHVYQTLHHKAGEAGVGITTLMLYLPHVSKESEMPWYHPAVKALAYMHVSSPFSKQTEASDAGSLNSGELGIYAEPFPSKEASENTQDYQPPKRLVRTAQNLLSTIHKHGLGHVKGYIPQPPHDNLVAQSNLQDTYTALKARYAKDLCERWVEETDPSKHVFEDLGIAAFLIEVWSEGYKLPKTCAAYSKAGGSDARAEFPGFVDIGCGNGVLVEILRNEGFSGWGFDARRRKTWSILSASTQEHLREEVLLPCVLLDGENQDAAWKREQERELGFRFNLGQFPRGTFIISNHADELTPWTPLLAYLSDCPFLAIPCCSHNFSGKRFRAPTAFNSYSAGEDAPNYFDSSKTKNAKHIPISIPANSAEPVKHKQANSCQAAESGDLKQLAPKARASQPSAYSALCKWINYLAKSLDFVVETELLRIPSTRNVGILCRRWRTETESDEKQHAAMNAPYIGSEPQAIDPRIQAERHARIQTMATTEGADIDIWIQRIRGLRKGGADGEVLLEHR